MPKPVHIFRAQIAFHSDFDLYEKLIALGYMRSARNGTYASVARDLLTQAVDQQIEDMTYKERQEFKVILDSVKARVAIENMEREEKLKARLQAKEPRSQPGDTEDSRPPLDTPDSEVS